MSWYLRTAWLAILRSVQLGRSPGSVSLYLLVGPCFNPWNNPTDNVFWYSSVAGDFSEFAVSIIHLRIRTGIYRRRDLVLSFTCSESDVRSLRLGLWASKFSAWVSRHHRCCPTIIAWGLNRLRLYVLQAINKFILFSLSALCKTSTNENGSHTFVQGLDLSSIDVIPPTGTPEMDKFLFRNGQAQSN